MIHSLVAAAVAASFRMLSRIPSLRSAQWLEGRGAGVLDGSTLREASATVRALDLVDIDAHVDAGEDGTPGDSVNEVFCRMRNTVAKSASLE